MIFGYIPAFYADVSESYLLVKWKRVVVALAGGLGQFLLWLVAIHAWLVLEPGSWLQSVAYLFALMNMFAVFQTLVPFGFKSDGYIVLTDLTDTENLFARSYAHCWARIQQVFDRGRPLPEPDLPRRTEILFWSYVLPSFFIVLVGFLFGYWMMIQLWHIQPFWITLFMFISMGMFFTRLAQGLIGAIFSGYKKWRGRQGGPPIRPAYGLALAALAVVLVFFLPVPRELRVPSRVVPRKVEVVRAGIDGVLASPRVRQGDMVTEGTLLATLSNPSLQSEYQKAIWNRVRRAADSKAALSRLTAPERVVETLGLDVVRLRAERSESSFVRELEAFRSGILSRDDLGIRLNDVEKAKALLALQEAKNARALEDPSGLDLLIEAGKTRVGEVEIERLERDLQRLELRASASGTVLTPDPDRLAGRHVKKGERIFEIGSPGLALELQLPEEDMAHVSEGDPLRFLAWARSTPLRGRIERLQAEARAGSRPTGAFSRYQFRASSAVRTECVLDQPPPDWLRVGMTGVAHIRLGWQPAVFVWLADQWRVVRVNLWGGT